MDWMAWTWPTAIFFMVIASLLITFTVLAISYLTIVWSLSAVIRLLETHLALPEEAK